MKKQQKKRLLAFTGTALSLILIVILAIGGTAGFRSLSKTADMKITIRPEKTYQTFDGFGSSACWWSQKTPDDETRQELARLLYSKEGLGLNIYRYNVGGGYDPAIERVTNPWRLTESFYVQDEATGQWKYDFTRDANAQKMLETALSYGCIDTVVLFANSPHYSMTVSGMSSGGLQENVTNLKQDCYDDFVDYLLTITEYFLSKGVPVKYISPVNEPQWKWGGGYVSQEGCHYRENEVIELMEMFAKEIRARKLPVQLCAPESGEIGDTTYHYFEALKQNETIGEQLGQLSYHSYFKDQNQPAKTQMGEWLTENAAGCNIAMSEWCELPCRHNTESMEGALIMARVIAQDIALTGVNSWSAWVAVNQTGEVPLQGDFSDGLISASENFEQYSVAIRYHALAHYSKYIPAGSVRVEADSFWKPVTQVKLPDSETAELSTVNYTAFLTPEDTLVLVLVNEGETRDVSFSCEKENMTVVQTDEVRREETVYSGPRCPITVPENSIITVVFSD